MIRDNAFLLRKWSHPWVPESASFTAPLLRASSITTVSGRHGLQTHANSFKARDVLGCFTQSLLTHLLTADVVKHLQLAPNPLSEHPGSFKPQLNEEIISVLDDRWGAGKGQMDCLWFFNLSFYLLVHLQTAVLLRGLWVIASSVNKHNYIRRV